ncbi:MAG: helix-turn-helix transcriptional regulator, partial [Nakamurella sp.]
TGQVNQGWATLAPAELRIVRMVARAMTNREIAAQLFLSKHTVDSHLKRAFSKLNVRSRVELTRLLMAYESTARDANPDPEAAALTG